MDQDREPADLPLAEEWPAQASPPGDTETDPPGAGAWSPPQFSLKGIGLVMILAGGFFTIVRYLGADAAFPTIVIAGVIWLALGCLRLVRLSRQGREIDDEF
jgi:hypothetical protein